MADGGKSICSGCHIDEQPRLSAFQIVPTLRHEHRKTGGTESLACLIRSVAESKTAEQAALVVSTTNEQRAASRAPH